MSVRDLLALSLGALLKNRRRTLLSLLGVAIGVAAVVVLTALGEGARRYVRGQFESIGSNVLIVLPGKTETTGVMPGFAGTPNDLTLDDARALQRGLTEALHVAPVSMGNETIAAGQRSRQVMVLGTVPEFRHVRDLAVRAGSFLPEQPWDRGAPEAVIGSKVAGEIFPGENPLGEVVRLGGWRMRVVGILEGRGVQLGIDMDDLVIVPVATGMRMFNRSSLFRVIMKLRPGADHDLAADRVRSMIIDRHGEEDVTLLTQDAVVGSLSAILDVLTYALAGIAAISLTVAGIGIMNVMLVSVFERTREIGLVKALGAAPRQILGIFLAEAAMLATAGGVMGLALGWLLVGVLVSVYPNFPARPPVWAVGAALGTSLVVGIVFGVLPARRAARLDPVAALAGRAA